MTARLRELPADRLLTMQEAGLMYLVLLPSSCALDAVNPACVPDRVLFVPGAKYRRGLLAPQHAWPWSGRQPPRRAAAIAPVVRARWCRTRVL